MSNFLSANTNGLYSHLPVQAEQMSKLPSKGIEVSQHSINQTRVCSQVCVKDTNNVEVDSDVSLEIPSDTVIAYSILELEIKKNGHYGECERMFACVLQIHCLNRKVKRTT